MKNEKFDANQKIPYYFIFLALLSLAAGLIFGCIGAGQYIFPELFKDIFSFVKIRPMHVTLVICWIVLCATGSVYYFLSKESGGKIYSVKLPAFHFRLYLITGITILVCYALGVFGGREYMEYSPLFFLPVLLGWLIFAVNYFKTIISNKLFHNVYFWMWGTGILFFIITLSEAHLYLIPYFRDNLVRDITVQWKSYGAMIGSWNMLIYGTASYLMEKTTNDNDNVTTRNFMSLPFFLYFVGLTNLLFGWAHHTYILPTKPWVREIAYAISMTELVILAIMIWQWKYKVTGTKNYFSTISFQFLVASDYWIALNLILAILISVPAINFFTHGTHITVAHAMGTTIGINTSILLASLFYILSENIHFLPRKRSVFSLTIAFYVFYVSFFIFWICLIIMGIYRSGWMYGNWYQTFRDMKEAMMPFIIIFFVSGIGIMTGLFVVIFPAMRFMIKIMFAPDKK